MNEDAAKKNELYERYFTQLLLMVILKYFYKETKSEGKTLVKQLSDRAVVNQVHIVGIQQCLPNINKA